jgi:hypothetical protein
MLREANEYKSAGNELFAKADYDAAIAKYEDALLACPERSSQERAVFFSNIAACLMKQVSMITRDNPSHNLSGTKFVLLYYSRTNLPKLKNHVQAH